MINFRPWFYAVAVLSILTSSVYSEEITSKELDQKYGELSMPAYVKHFEVNQKKQVLVASLLTGGYKNSNRSS